MGTTITGVGGMQWIFWRRPQPPPCTIHHWHAADRGWRCCHGNHLIRHSRDQPDHTTTRCVGDDDTNFDDLQRWLKFITGPNDTAPTLIRRLRASA